jgi:hypothetical protein
MPDMQRDRHLASTADFSGENSHAGGVFLSGYVQSGVSKAICQCTFQKLEGKYSSAELRSGRSDKLLQDVITSADACRHG